MWRQLTNETLTFDWSKFRAYSPGEGVRKKSRVWGGHSCPPPLTFALTFALNFALNLFLKNRFQPQKTINVKSGGQECAPHLPVAENFFEQIRSLGGRILSDLALFLT